jgi:peptidoglycan/LPS O-acetylase OafA/YrhL
MGGPFLSTSWFVGLIVVLYLSSPLLSKGIRNRPHIMITFCFLLSTISRVILGKYRILPTRPMDWFPLCRVFEFGLGIYLANTIRKEAWASFNGMEIGSPLFLFISEISYPLFFIHYPCLFVISYLGKYGVNQSLSIVAYLFLSIVLSWAMVLLDRFIQRSIILDRIFRIRI